MLHIVFTISILILLICFSCLFFKIYKYLKQKEKYKEELINEKLEIEILNNILPDIKLKEKGTDIDEIIKYILEDTEIEFSLSFDEMELKGENYE